MKANLKTWYDDNFASIKAEWFEFLRFPSVGTNPAHLDDCRACAEWLNTWLARLGFDVRFIGGDNVPNTVYAVRPADDGTDKKRVMMYGHYDVQPADPIELWDTDPWVPTERDGCVFARGAQDDKGQFFFQLAAVRFCVENKIPLPEIRVVIDGQEEGGSHVLLDAIRHTPELFGADILMVADTSMTEDNRPAITAGLRGISSVSFRLDGPSHDLHSGKHGGMAPNPAQALAHIVAALHNADGSIAVENFMDDFVPPHDDDLDIVLAEPFDAAAYAAETGIAPLGTDTAIPPQVRGTLYPTIEVNGFHSGYGGAGGKTIIPAWAEVKLSMRLCRGQDGERCVAAVVRHFEERVRNGLRLTVTFREPGAPAFKVALDSAAMTLAKSVLDDMSPRGSVIVWDGASIPVVGVLANASGADALLVGFGLERDRIHAPNESFALDRAEMAFTYAARMLSALGGSAAFEGVDA